MRMGQESLLVTKVRRLASAPTLPVHCSRSWGACQPDQVRRGDRRERCGPDETTLEPQSHSRPRCDGRARPAFGGAVRAMHGSHYSMVTLTLQLDDESASRLQPRAEEVGVTPEEFAAQEVTRSLQDPFEFIGVGESDASVLDTDRLLAGGFGTR